jgi:hypothetical protein
MREGLQVKVYWSETRWNGQPLQPGTVCLVTDLEDGTNPIYTYGKDQQEILDKLARQNANAQLALARRAAQPTSSPTPAGAGPTPTSPAAPRRGPTPDQVMQATADLSNPAKAGAAVATLMQHATGVDPIEQAKQAYADLAVKWEDATPAFFPHPGNRQLLGEKAIRMAGNKPGMVTWQILQAAFEQLEAGGLLFERPEEPNPNPNNQTLTTFPAENQVQPIERSRSTRFATGARSTSFSAPQTALTRALKYTEEQIRNMPERTRREVFNDPEYIRACDFYYSGAAARTGT